MSTARPAAARSRARLPDAGGQGRGAVEFLLKLAGAKILAEVLELLDVDGERAVDVIGVGGENVAPDFVGAEREARHVFETRTGGLLARRCAELIGDGGGERGGGELRKMAGEGDDADAVLQRFDMPARVGELRAVDFPGNLYRSGDTDTVELRIIPADGKPRRQDALAAAGVAITI